MTDLATLRDMLTRQIENRENRVSRRQRRADVREKNRGFRHAAGDYQIAREEGLLRELLAIYDGLNVLAERAERAERAEASLQKLIVTRNEYLAAKKACDEAEEKFGMNGGSEYLLLARIDWYHALIAYQNACRDVGIA